MVLPLLCLIGGTLTAWAGVAFVVHPQAASVATLAMAITLPPAVMTFLAVVRGCRRWPQAGPVFVMVGTFVRMVAALVCVALLSDRAAEFGTTPTDLAQWTTGFYLVTLVLETGLLAVQLSRSAKGVRNEPPTG